jgi:hypothetical protein
MAKEQCPPVTAELLSWLAGVFPDQLPSIPQADLAEVNVRIGQQRVIRKLREQHNLQHEQSLSGQPR